MKADLTVYKDREGRFRWRFLVDDDIRAISSDSYISEEEAIKWAEIIVLSPWYKVAKASPEDIKCTYRSEKKSWWKRLFRID